MSTDSAAQIERLFLSLPPEQRVTIIRHGVALRMSDLRKRLFLAESKVRQFEEKYGTTLACLDTQGLLDDAHWEMHEDYIMWHHWTRVARQAASDIDALQAIAQ